jgi:hypothetical protein
MGGMSMFAFDRECSAESFDFFAIKWVLGFSGARGRLRSHHPSKDSPVTSRLVARRKRADAEKDQNHNLDGSRSGIEPLLPLAVLRPAKGRSAHG